MLALHDATKEGRQLRQRTCGDSDGGTVEGWLGQQQQQEEGTAAAGSSEAPWRQLPATPGEQRTKQSIVQETAETICSLEQGLELLVQMVSATSLQELNPALGHFSYECMAVVHFYVTIVPRNSSSVRIEPEGEIIEDPKGGKAGDRSTTAGDYCASTVVSGRLQDVRASTRAQWKCRAGEMRRLAIVLQVRLGQAQVLHVASRPIA